MWITHLLKQVGDSHFYVIISQAHIIADFLKKGTKWTQLTMTNILQCQYQLVSALTNAEKTSQDFTPQRTHQALTL